MNLCDVQERVDTWIQTTAGGYWGQFEILARLTEELGELSAALQRDQGLRPRESDTEVAEEVGDVLFTLAAFANARKINLQDTIEQVLAKYEERDGEAWRSRSAEGLQS